MLLSRSLDRRQKNCEIFGITKAARSQRSKQKSSRLWCSIRICIKELWCDQKKPGKFSRVEEMSPLSGFLMTKKHSRVKNHKESCRRIDVALPLEWSPGWWNWKNRSTKDKHATWMQQETSFPYFVVIAIVLQLQHHSIHVLSVLFDHRFGRSHSMRLDFPTATAKEAVRTCNLINRERF